MEWVETTGRTIEEALDAALDELGVNEDEVEYEIVEQPKSGFLGRFGGTEARIRARIRPISREKPGDRRRRRRDERRGRDDGGRPREPAATGAPGGVGVDDSERDSDSGAPRPAGGTRRRRRGSGGGGQAGQARRSPDGPNSRTTEDDTMTESAVPLDEQVSVATAFTQGLLEQFGLPAQVSGRAEGDDDVYIDVTGDQLGVLIGPRGATLDAMQELVKTAVQHRTGGFTARMHIDVAGYRASRHEALAEFARSVAQTALETGRDQVLEPMNSADRKVVHDVVAEIEGVATTSEGEDPRRRVVIRRV